MAIDPSTITDLQVHQLQLIDAEANHNKFYDVFYATTSDDITYVITHYGRNGTAGTWKQHAASYTEMQVSNAASELIRQKHKKGYVSTTAPTSWVPVPEGEYLYTKVADVCQPFDPNQDPHIKAAIPGDALNTLIEDARRAITLASDPENTYEAASLRESLQLTVSEVRERLLYAESQLEIIDSLVSSQISMQ